MWKEVRVLSMPKKKPALPRLINTEDAPQTLQALVTIYY